MPASARFDEAAGGGAVALVEFDGEADQVVVAGLYAFEVEAFDDPDLGAEHDEVGLDAVLVKATDAEVIDAHGLHAAVDEILRAFLGDVDEVLVELGPLPAPGGVAGLEEEALA